MKKSPAFMPKVLLVAISIGAITSCATSGSGNRAVAADGRAIHGPDQLDEFFLEKPVNLQGLGTKAALEKLDREYRSSCRKAGEVPLELAYEIPAGYERPLNFQVGYTFEHAVGEIAATSGLDWKRRGNVYRFQAPKVSPGVRLRQETLLVPPDFLSRIAGGSYDRKWGARGAFEKRGVSLDQSTQLTVVGSRFHVETRSPSDLGVISGVVDAMVRQSPKQYRLAYRTFEIPADHSWKAPANGIVSETDLAELRRVPGVQEYVSEWGPYDTRFDEASVIRGSGKMLRYQAHLVGLGVQVKAEFDQAARAGKPVVVTAEGQTPDGGTRIATTTRKDGSSVVLAITPTVIDATGRPVKKSP